eukprot:COSAG01_NODE_6856_length_3468_cov_1.978629_4_plen_47_part_00
MWIITSVSAAQHVGKSQPAAQGLMVRLMTSVSAFQHVGKSQPIHKG